MNSAQADRYLSLLGCGRETPGVGYLTALIRAELWRVPFENVSKLYYLRRDGFRGIPDTDTYLDGIERHGFGGTCYATNFHFHELLSDLGFDIQLHGADMAAADVHLVSSVQMDGIRFLVDVGYGAPLTSPMPLSAGAEQTFGLGNEWYVFNGPAMGKWAQLEHYRDGECIHGYRVNPRPRSIGEFSSVILDSYHGDATFMRNLVATRYTPEKGETVRNLARIDFNGETVSRRDILGIDDLADELERTFGMSRTHVQAAIDMLREHGAEFLH